MQNESSTSGEMKDGGQDKSSRSSFLFGIITGVAVLSTIGFAITLTMLLTDDDSTKVASTNTAAVNANPAPSPTPTPTQPPEEPVADATKLREVSERDHVRGNANAAVTILEFSDYECSYCASHHPTLQQVITEYSNDVRWVYRHFPLSFHDNAQSSAEASECAADQGKFWEFSDALFETTKTFSADLYDEIAGDLGMNVSTFSACASSGEKANNVEADYAEGIAAGVRGTPAMFINDELVSGALPYEQLKAIIDTALAS